MTALQTDGTEAGRTSIAVVVVAAGRGSRMGGSVPKQYLELGGIPILRRTLALFLDDARIGCVRTVIHPDDVALYREAVAGIDSAKLHAPVHGGDTRAASVRRGLHALVDAAPDLVLVHDAARPFTPRHVIDDVIDALDDGPGACAALRVVDALWRAQDDAADAPVPRDGLWRAQTPQGFRFDALLAAHDQHDGTGADDVAVAREAGMAVRFVEGCESNFKITTQADLARAEQELVRHDAMDGRT